MKYVVFSMADEEFGISVDRVREVLNVPHISPLPELPDFIEGVITLHRHSIAVMDLRKLFNMHVEKESRAEHVIVVSSEGMIMGLLVDSVSEIVDLSPKQVDAASRILDGYLDGKAVSGIAHAGERVILILQVSNILNPELRSELLKARK